MCAILCGEFLWRSRESNWCLVPHQSPSWRLMYPPPVGLPTTNTGAINDKGLAYDSKTSRELVLYCRHWRTEIITITAGDHAGSHEYDVYYCLYERKQRPTRVPSVPCNMTPVKLVITSVATRCQTKTLYLLSLGSCSGFWEYFRPSKSIKWLVCTMETPCLQRIHIVKMNKYILS